MCMRTADSKPDRTKSDCAGAIVCAFAAAVLYALSSPVSKYLLRFSSPTMMAAFLYLGAGTGIGILSVIRRDKRRTAGRLGRKDLPYVIGMIVLDIIAPVLLMRGLLLTNASTASMLNNFEIVATSLIALIVFRERISIRLWCGIAAVTIASILLSVTDFTSLQLSSGSLLILGACVCWGLENNCTRMISDRDTYEIVFIKGICSGAGSLVIALSIGDKVPDLLCVLVTLLLGFTAYGLSIFFYIRAQKVIGAAKTSAYYASSPFIGAFFSVLFLKETLDIPAVIGFLIMIPGTILVISDTMRNTREKSV